MERGTNSSAGVCPQVGVVGKEPPGSEMLSLAAGTWLGRLRVLSDMGGPRVSAIVLCLLNINYNTNTSLLLHSLYIDEINFRIFPNGIKIELSLYYWLCALLRNGMSGLATSS